MPSFEIFHSSKYPELQLEARWYYRACQPGGLPESEPIGAFDTRQETEAAVDLELAELGDLSLEPLDLP